jgi:hypothetical protein
MTRKFTFGSIVMMASALLALSAAVPTRAHAQAQKLALKRVLSEFTAFDGNFIDVDSTSAVDGGVPIFFNDAVKTPGNANFAYITLNSEARGDCNGIAFNCVLDGVNCNNGFNPVTGSAFDDGFFPITENPDGWITLAGNNDTFDFINFGPQVANYTWCTPLAKEPKNLHTLQINAGEDGSEFIDLADCTELLSAVSVFMDTNVVGKHSAFLANACQSYPTPNIF